MSDDLDPDHINRTALMFLRGSVDASAGLARFHASRMRILAGGDVVRSREGQAALLTAVMTSTRAFAEVVVVVKESDSELLGGPKRGHVLREVLGQEGVRIQNDIDPSDPVPTLVLGNLETRVDCRDWLMARWTGWTASVLPLGAVRADELGNSDGNVLASIAAGALGVAELFLRALPEPESDAGNRPITIDFWAPRGGASIQPPGLEYAPAQWWLLGLGHLGQGFAHVLSWLGYHDPAEVQIVLHDVQRTVPANHSTGLLTPAGSEGERKTRLVASALERCGYDTVVVERLLDHNSLVRPTDTHVAMVGVDNLQTRLLIEGAGWPTAIDVGLGAGAADFDGITVVRFPGRPDSVVRSWQQWRPSGLGPRNERLEVPGLDACGVARLNGTAVGASFVGAIAGVLGIAESLRCLHGGVSHSILSLSLREREINGGLVDAEHPASLELG